MKQENKKTKKSSPNRITCQISGQKRMSNAKYIAAKAEKAGVSSALWCSFYVNKESYKQLVADVSDFGFSTTADKYKVHTEQLKKWLRYNGRGGFVKIAKIAEQATADNKKLELLDAAADQSELQIQTVS
jgi:PBP1b-binding outer membrane lipoprotein LpoB